MHEVLPGIPGARAEGQARFSGQLPALQQAHHLRVRFGRPQHPKGAVERKRNQIGARSGSQVASLKSSAIAPPTDMIAMVARSRPGTYTVRLYRPRPEILNGK